MAKNKLEIFLYKGNLEELNAFTKKNHGLEYEIASLEAVRCEPPWIGGAGETLKTIDFEFKKLLGRDGYVGAIHYLAAIYHTQERSSGNLCFAEGVPVRVKK